MMRIAALAGFTTLGTLAAAQVYPPTPDWQSADRQVSTGAALADINRDGWLDLVVSNGNDMQRQRVVVYYNNAGTLSTSPGWQSGDIDYHGHLDIADVNADGWPDVAVANLLVTGGRPSAKLYLNHSGTLSSLPDWVAPISAESFGLAFGDMNGDGRPDLAVASGDAYNNVGKTNAVYLGTGTSLTLMPAWQTPAPRNFGACLWIDADRDGRLDLCYNGSNTDTFVYRNTGTTLETTPTWRTNDSRTQFALMTAWGDVTGDGLPELIIADNNQINGGSGRFRMYTGAAAGFFATTAAWTYTEGYTAAVALGDINNDGRLDLCTGEWFGRTRYFLNTGTGLPAAPTWTNTPTPATTVEKICLGDLRNRALRTRTFAPVIASPQKLFFLPRRPVQAIVSVTDSGIVLGPDRYTWNADNGWLSLAAATTDLRVVYTYSLSLDMAVANWDDTQPNQAYYNRTPVFCMPDFNSDGGIDGSDVEAFFRAWESAEPLADTNEDGGIDGADVEAFFRAWETGEC